METIILNGKATAFVVTDNGYYKFYLCESFSEAEDLNAHLSDSAIVFTQQMGWMVRILKK